MKTENTNHKKYHSKGIELLRDPQYNKDNAFTDEERDSLHLRGLLPPAVTDIEL